MRKEANYWDNLAKYGPEASVIDPNDKIGNKNRYISLLRNTTLAASLNSLEYKARVLDFGCGSGVFLGELDRKGYTSVGLDISKELLTLAKKRNYSNQPLLVQYDGANLPFTPGCFMACLTYSVLIYVLDDKKLSSVLNEIYSVLAPGAILIAVEQIRRENRISADGMKIQRTKVDFVKFLKNAGFHSIKTELVRRGHFPLLYLIRYGIIPRVSFPLIIKFERLMGHHLPNVIWDYGDMKFSCRK